jgi:hypothetical protein
VTIGSNRDHRRVRVGGDKSAIIRGKLRRVHRQISFFPARDLAMSAEVSGLSREVNTTASSGKRPVIASLTSA